MILNEEANGCRQHGALSALMNDRCTRMAAQEPIEYTRSMSGAGVFLSSRATVPVVGPEDLFPSYLNLDI